MKSYIVIQWASGYLEDGIEEIYGPFTCEESATAFQMKVCPEWGEVSELKAPQ